MEDDTLTAVKDFAANSFIPKAVLVGVLGNFINFVILSRWVFAMISCNVAIFNLSNTLQTLHQKLNKHLSIDIGFHRHIVPAADLRVFETISPRRAPSGEWSLLANVWIKSMVLHVVSWVFAVSSHHVATQIESVFPVYISVYLTLSLALDRYDAVRHPRTRCSIARAKNVVSSELFSLCHRAGIQLLPSSPSCALSSAMHEHWALNF